MMVCVCIINLGGLHTVESAKRKAAAAVVFFGVVSKLFGARNGFGLGVWRG
jgi:hypothetical protein